MSRLLPARIEETIREFEDALGGDWSIASRLAAINKSFVLVELAPNGKILHVNGNFSRLMGYSLKDIKGQHHRVLCYDDEAQSVEYTRFWQKLRAGESVVKVQLQRSADGRPVWFQAIFAPVLTPQGEVERVLIIAVDITRAQNLASESESKLSALSLSNGIVEIAVDGEILKANAQFLSLFGYASDEVDEVVGRPHAQLCPADYANSSEYQTFWRDLCAGQHKTGVFRRLSRFGDAIWISASYNPILDSAGEVVRIMTFAQDITAPFVESLQHAQRIDALKAMQAVLDLDCEGRILDASQRFVETSGLDVRHVLGKRICEIFDAQQLAESQGQDWWQAIISGQIITGDLQCNVSGAATGCWTMTFQPIRDFDGIIDCVLMSGYPCTETNTLVSAAAASG